MGIGARRCNLCGRVVEIAGYQVAGLGGVFRGKIWDAQQSIETLCAGPCAPKCGGEKELPAGIGPASFRRTTFSCVWAARQHSGDARSVGSAPVWLRAIDELTEALGVQVVVHGHHHRIIDYVGEGLMSGAAPFRAFGVDKGSHLAWPREPQGEAGLGGVPQGLLDLATQVLGAKAQTCLDNPHQLFGGRTPAAIAVEGGLEAVRSMLNAVQNGGVV